GERGQAVRIVRLDVAADVWAARGRREREQVLRLLGQAVEAVTARAGGRGLDALTAPEVRDLADHPDAGDGLPVVSVTDRTGDRLGRDGNEPARRAVERGGAGGAPARLEVRA